MEGIGLGSSTRPEGESLPPFATNPVEKSGANINETNKPLEQREAVTPTTQPQQTELASHSIPVSSDVEVASPVASAEIANVVPIEDLSSNAEPEDLELTMKGIFSANSER